MKNTDQKSHCTVPLIRIQKSHMTRRGMIPPGETDLPGCDTRGDFDKFELLRKILTKIENILTHWFE